MPPTSNNAVSEARADDLASILPGYGQRRRYYTPEEVALHNCADDCWVTALGHVYDLTELIGNNLGPLAKPLVEQAGKDISYLFDPKTGDLKVWVEPTTNLRQYYTPCGRFIHVPPSYPQSQWKTNIGLPWWQNSSYRIGRLSQKTRKVKVVNTLTKREDTLTVCSEETIEEIRDRYLEYNAHAASYAWKKLEEGKFMLLEMRSTLEENGIKDEADEFEALGIESDLYIPILHLYFKDDLTTS